MTSNLTPEEHLPLPSQYTSGKIGVVTVLFNSAQVLPEFFSSIESQTYTNITVYCVDNASTDGSAALCTQRGAPYLVIKNPDNRGVAAGNNQGIRAAIQDGCEYIMLLNNDVVFGADMFQLMLDGMQSHHADITTPKIYYHDRPNVLWCAGGSFNPLLGYRQIHYGEGTIDSAEFSKDRRVSFSPTCCVLVKRELFAYIGTMDERYFVYWDDTDWMLRAHKANIAMWYLHAPKIWHKVSSLTGPASRFTTVYTCRNHAYYFYKHLPRLIAVVYSALYQTIYRLLSVIPNRHDDAKLSLKSWRDGVTMFYSQPQ